METWNNDKYYKLGTILLLLLLLLIIMISINIIVSLLLEIQ